MLALLRMGLQCWVPDSVAAQDSVVAAVQF